MPTLAGQSNAPSDYQPLREWVYTVQIVGHSWAGTYSRSPLTGKAQRSGSDGHAVKAGGGVEGRITGGTCTAYNEAEVREYLDETYILKEKRTVKEDDGTVAEIEVTTHSYHLLTLEPRTVVGL